MANAILRAAGLDPIGRPLGLVSGPIYTRQKRKASSAMQPIFNRSFIALLATLGLALASCSGGDISRGRAAATASAGGSTTAQATAAPGAPAPSNPITDGVATAVAALGGPGASQPAGTPSAPPFVWDFENSPTPYPSPTTDTNCSHVSTCGWEIMQDGGQ